MKPIYKIKLDLSEVNSFLDTANSINNDVNLSQGISVVSGKSLIGMLTLDFNKPISLIIRDVPNDDDSVIDKFQRWIIG